MSDLSPAAEAVLAAITQQQYSLDPGDIPNEAGRMACIAAVALRAVADQVVPESEPPQRDSFSDRSVWQWAVDCHNHDVGTRSKILAIAAELES